MSAMIFQSVTLGLVIYLVIWTLVWFRKNECCRDSMKDLNLGDCIKACGQRYRIDTIEIIIGDNGVAKISAHKIPEGENDNDRV